MRETHKTAIKRTKASAPAQVLHYANRLTGNMLDYGCGHGYDAAEFDMDAYDKYYYPSVCYDDTYDTILCTYVLNVVSKKEQQFILDDIKRLLTPWGTAYITVRNDLECNSCTQRNVKLRLPQLVHNKKWFRIYILRRGEKYG